jgi:DNA-binding MarR family transcriptional regulator
MTAPSTQGPSALRQASELRFLVLAAQREGNRQLTKALRGLGLTPAQAEVISALDEHGSMTLATLGRCIVCENGSPSRLVNTLVIKGLVERESGQVDRRVVHLELSPKGRELLQGVKEIDDAINRSILECLAGAELQAVIGALQAIVRGTPAGAKVAFRFPAGD